MQTIVMTHPDCDLAEFELERILAFSDLVISYSYDDDSTRAKRFPLMAFIADDELWITSSPKIIMSLWREVHPATDETS